MDFVCTLLTLIIINIKRGVAESHFRSVQGIKAIIHNNIVITPVHSIFSCCILFSVFQNCLAVNEKHPQ